MRTALIGLGRIGWQFHLNEIINHKEYNLCAVVDTSLDRLKEAKDLYGVNGYTDYKEMLNTEKPDLTVIASPTIFHEEQAIKAMESGSDVILDKPMAQSEAAAKRIAEVHKATGKKLIIYQPHRFTAEAVVAKNIIQSGKLGPIFDIKRTCVGYSRRNDWQAFKDLGGGMMNNYGAHYIDQLIYITNEKVIDSYCIMNTVATLGDAEDVVKLVMKTDKNTILDIDISQASALGLPMFMIFGKYGAATLVSDHNGLNFKLRYFNPNNIPDKQVSRKMEAEGRAYPSEQINWTDETILVKPELARDFYAECYKYFSGQTPSPIPVEETLEVMRIIELNKNA